MDHQVLWSMLLRDRGVRIIFGSNFLWSTTVKAFEWFPIDRDQTETKMKNEQDFFEKYNFPIVYN